MKDIIQIVKSCEDSDLLINSVTKTTGNKAKGQRGRFFGMLLATLDASLLGNMLPGKGVIRARKGKILSRAGCLMPPQPLINFQIKKILLKQAMTLWCLLKKWFVS